MGWEVGGGRRHRSPKTTTCSCSYEADLKNVVAFENHNTSFVVADACKRG